MELQESSLSFDKYWQIIQRRWMPALVIFMPVFLISVLALSFLRKPIYVAQAKLRFQRTNITSTITGVGTEIGKLEPVVQDSRTNPLNTEAEVIRSLPLVQKTINKLNLKDNKGNRLKNKDFLKNLTVQDVKGSDVLQISYRDINPQTATKVVNTLVKLYLAHNESAQRSQATTARKFIEKQIPYAELIVRQAEGELAEFKEKHKIVSLQEEATRGVEVIAELQQQISAVQSQLANAKAQSQDIRKRLGMNSEQAVIVTSLSQIPGVQDILREIQQLESQLATRRTLLRDNHPQIVDLKDRLTSLKELLQQRIKPIAGTNKLQLNNFQLGQLQQQLSARLVDLESTRLGFANQAAALSNLQAEHKQRLNVLPRLEQQQRQLERKVQAAQSTYSLLLQRLQESRIAENQNVGNASMISHAEVPEEPISSPIMRYVSAGLLASLAGLATIYLLEANDKSIKTIDEAKELLGLNVLGVIPCWGNLKKSIGGNEEFEPYNRRLVVRYVPRSPISEAYRMLQTNLNFITADQKSKVIVVTSSVPKEGKSTVAANLAIAMAQMDHKVLLVDGNLHRPVQHHIWDIPNDLGLSNVIVGQTELSIAVKTVMDNLDVLTAGMVPSFPTSLLDSRKMVSLMEMFATDNDFVIIDAPSLRVAAHAAILGHMADGVLLVVRPGVVDSANGWFAREFLENSGQNVLGLVVNAVNPKNEPHRHFYFGDDFYAQDDMTSIVRAS